jgi:nucleotide-binding universal stress UspA family protein
MAMLRIRSILHPTDFSDHAAAALELAGAIAKDYGARLTILHVKSPPLVASGVMTPEPLETPEEAAELRKNLYALRPPDPSVEVEHLMLVGDEATEIVRLAEEEGADMIVMGTHGRGGIGRLLMGSVADKVLRRAPCPVLTIKRPPHAVRPKEVAPTWKREAVAAGLSANAVR